MMKKIRNSARVLIEESDAAEVVKAAKSSKKEEIVSFAILSFFLIIIVIGLVAGVIMLTHKISGITKKLAPSSASSGESGNDGLSFPKPSPGMALQGVGSGSGTGGTSQSQAQTYPGDMVLVPAGEYIKGWNENGAPVKASVPAFYIDKYEVTNRLYSDFVRATGHKPPTDPRGSKYNIWKNEFYPSELANHPVVNVSYQDAEEYAQWVKKRLPTEEEWERAARGNEGFIYPWGNDYNSDFANGNDNRYRKGTTTPVGTFANDRSSFGVFDLAGNVREWTTTPYSPNNRQWKVLKGGCFGDGAEGLSTYERYQGTMPAPNVGFRCVKDVK
jgi:formylglycine-generating enzyme